MDEVLEEVGLVDLVFPRGRQSDNGDNYEDKLRAFVHYQPVQTHKSPDIPEAIKVSSAEGRVMLKEALNSPYMEAYYTVSPQIDNQTEYTCGTSCLVVALNSLDIDPARATWNEEWRWNHLGSLACCTPVLQNANICLDQFACLALCNDMRVFTMTVADDWTLNDFRTWVKMALTRSDIVMVVNHGRREMHQEGSGHFLPMTGYCEGRDMILSYDIAKHKHVPQWYPLRMMLNAVKAKDDRSGLNRGFVLLLPPAYESSERIFGPSIVFRIDDVSGQMDERLKWFMQSWNRILDENIPEDVGRQEIITSTIRNFISVTNSNNNTSSIALLEMNLVYFKNNRRQCPSVVARCRRPQCPKSCPNTMFCLQIQSLNIFRIVQTAMECFTQEERASVLNLVVNQLENIDSAVRFAKTTSQSFASMQRTVKFFNELYSDGKAMNSVNESCGEKGPSQCLGHIELFPEHIITFLLMSWPYVDEKGNDVFGQNAFRPILNAYHLPHLGNTENDERGRTGDEGDKEGKSKSYSAQNGKREEGTSLRKYLNEMTNKNFKNIEGRVLKEQIRGLQGKLLVVLDYHQLMV